MAASVLGASEDVRINHKKSRSLLKKERRKKKRQEVAKLRAAEENKDQEHISAEDEDEDLQYEIERQRLHEEWLVREQKAQEEFQLKLAKEEAARRREEEERKLIEEWRQQELKEKAEEPEQVKKREREEAVQKMLDEAESQLENGGVWHNPEVPNDYGTETDRANCSFYLKTGSCRFGDRCSRKHCFPSSSQTMLVRGMFITFGMERYRWDDYDTDAGLEYGDDEIYQQFLEFYEDVVPEFKNVGKLIQFKVSCNFEPHLRGNVYVQYQTEEECLQALSQFNGRWYAGRQLQCELSPVTKWKSAICGLYERQKCSRGKHCNFLHVFMNPNNEFWEANRDLNVSPDRRDRSSRYEDHGLSRRWYSPSPDSRRNGDSSRREKSHHKSKKKHRSHRSRNRKRSRSKSRKKRKRKNRSRSSSRSRNRRSKSSSRSKSRCRKSRSRSRSRSWSKSKSRSRSGSRGRRRSKSRSRSRSRSRGRRRSKSKSRSRSRSHSRSRSRGKKRSKSRERYPQSPSDRRGEEVTGRKRTRQGQDGTREERERQDSREQDRRGEEGTGLEEERMEQDRRGQDGTREEKKRQDSREQDRRGRDRTEEERRGWNRT
ncbi:U2 small nuclear ribonucleoprotein auxiliary factor 35 kDa subunit-related protein, partial [Pristimantis euphronides]